MNLCGLALFCFFLYLKSSDSQSHSCNDHSVFLNQLQQLVKAAGNHLEEKPQVLAEIRNGCCTSSQLMMLLQTCIKSNQKQPDLVPKGVLYFYCIYPQIGLHCNMWLDKHFLHGQWKKGSHQNLCSSCIRSTETRTKINKSQSVNPKS